MISCDLVRSGVISCDLVPEARPVSKTKPCLSARSKSGPGASAHCGSAAVGAGSPVLWTNPLAESAAVTSAKFSAAVPSSCGERVSRWARVGRSRRCGSGCGGRDMGKRAQPRLRNDDIHRVEVREAAVRRQIGAADGVGYQAEARGAVVASRERSHVAAGKVDGQHRQGRGGRRHAPGLTATLATRALRASLVTC